VVYETVEGERHPVLWATPSLGSSFPPVEIPAGHYFVLGDNRNRSRGSRWFGPVSRDSITGRMSAIVLAEPSNEVIDSATVLIWLPVFLEAVLGKLVYKDSSSERSS